MDGFFSKKEAHSTSMVGNKRVSCVSCGLFRNAESPKMAPHGKFKKDILIIDESPTPKDDERGRPWSGAQGRLFKKALSDLNIDVDEDCETIYAVRCLPTNKKGDLIKPLASHCTACRTSVMKHIQARQPKLIIACGIISVNSIIGHRWQRDMGGINKWRGWVIPDQDFKCWVAPVFHPGQVLDADPVYKTIFKQDLRRAVDHVETPWPRYKKPVIEYIEDLSPLNDITGQVSIDYETTGLKPHAKGHRIVCASVATSENHAYTFLLPKKKKDRQPFIDLLANPRIPKMAHNMKYEENWSVERLKQPVVGWEWDSMLATHLLDNRSGITSLKFQTYVNFGVVDYDSEISPYLAGKSKDGNSTNKVEELLLDGRKTRLLLEYCALDTIYQYRLAEKQMQQIGYDHLPF